MKLQIAMLILGFALVWGGGFLVGSVYEAGKHFSNEDVLKVYACGRADGEVITYRDGMIGCLIDGESFLIEYNGGSEFVDGRVTSTSTSQ